MQQNIRGNYAIPVSIVIAGVLVAGALFFSLGNSGASVAGGQPLPQAPVDTTDQVNPVTAEDHIRGSLDAKVTIVEYSDFECPFCKRFHPTMNQIMDDYVDSGDVAWVYRQFPLDSLHPVKARREAATSECVAEIGGNDKFWEFTDAFFAVTPSNNQTDLETVLPKIISDLGLSQSAIDTCVASGKYDQHIQDDIDNAIASGGQGTPWSIVLGANGDKLPLSGAQPVGAVKQLIEIMLNNQ